MAIQKRKLSRESLQARLTGGRSTLLVLVVLSVFNIVMTVLDLGYQLPYSATIPCNLVAFGKGMDNGSVSGAWTVTGVYTWTALVMAAAILAVYGLCWWFSRKHLGWIITALVLVSLDSLVLLLFLFVGGGASVVIDFCLHLWTVWLLIQAVSARRKLADYEILDQIHAREDAEEAARAEEAWKAKVDNARRPQPQQTAENAQEAAPEAEPPKPEAE